MPHRTNGKSTDQAIHLLVFEEQIWQDATRKESRKQLMKNQPAKNMNLNFEFLIIIFALFTIGVVLSIKLSIVDRRLFCGARSRFSLKTH